MKAKKSQKVEIIQAGNPILRKVSSDIQVCDIKTPKIKKIISQLKNAISSQSDAAAISAVQVGKPLRLFVVSKKVFGVDPKNPEEMKIKDDLIFINPKITKFSKTKQELEEGCLSVKYVYGKVERPEKVSIEAHNEEGKKFSRGFSGILAQIVQHENDHLNGILFTDKAVNLEKISPEEYEEILKNL